MKHLGYPESITTNERENGGGLREMKPEMHDGWGMHDPRQEGTGDREAYLGCHRGRPTWGVVARPHPSHQSDGFLGCATCLKSLLQLLDWTYEHAAAQG